MEDDEEIETLQQITNNNNNNTKFARAQIEHRQLLNNLKSTIETLFLNCNSGDLWPTSSSSVSSLTTNATPDGLLCLHTILEQIFRNGIRVFKPDNSPDIWRFIEGLNWLNPSMTVSIANRCTSPINIHHIPSSRIKMDKALCWIYENLESNQLSQKLKYLLSDMEHLSNCYEITAFLRNEKFTESLFICLTSIELNQVNLLSQIQQTLYCNKLNTINHRRSTSHPNFSFVNNVNIGKSIIKSIPITETTTASTDRIEVNKSQCVNDKKSHKLQVNSTIINKSSIKKKHIVNLKLRPWNSLPDLTPDSILLSSTAASLSSSSASTIKRFRCNTISQDIPTSSLFGQQQFLPLTVENLEKITNNSSAAKTCNTVLKCVTNNVNTNNIQKVPSFSYKQQFIQNSGDSINTNNYDLLLQSTSLLKCDDIKIHFDRRHIPNTIRNDVSEATNETASVLPEQPLLSLDLNEENSTNTLTTSDNIDNNTHNNNVKQTAFLNNLLSPFTKNYDKLSTDMKYNTMFSSSAPADFVNKFLTIDGEKLQNRYRNSTVLETLNISPTNYNDNIDQLGPSSQQLSPLTMQILPSQGQSLTSYLQAAQFSHGNTDLERENAHFNVSEAMISAIEQIKWSEIEKLKKKQIRAVEKLYDNSPVTQTVVGGVKRKSNIKKHKRWKQQHQQSQLQQREITEYDNSENSINLYSTTDDSNCSTNSSCNKNNNSSCSSNSSMDDDGNDPKYLQTLSVSTHSVNDHTAYAEWGENSLEALSAEGVALSLISKFSDKQLPRASDFSWLVSEQDAPQQLLPLPGSFSVSPDDIYKISVQRGTKDWAPPRPQIIFTRHPAPDRKKLLFKQNQRCAGCGMKVAAAYSHKFRYCEYLGKYHCTGCHRNQISVIPARVLDRWDFTFHPVSVFSYRLLDQIWNYPLFNVKDLNNILYEKVRSLKSAKIKRLQLKFINDFIMSCRFARETKLLFDDISNHLITDIDLWSLADFISIKNGNFNRNINKLIGNCEEHIFICELCLARGFICELCPRKQVIFPWQIKIKRCTDCGTCYHINCWKDHCTKCVRLKQRQLR